MRQGDRIGGNADVDQALGVMAGLGRRVGQGGGFGLSASVTVTRPRRVTMMREGSEPMTRPASSSLEDRLTNELGTAEGGKTRSLLLCPFTNPRGPSMQP